MLESEASNVIKTDRTWTKLQRSAPPTQYSYVWMSTLSNEQDAVPLIWQICFALHWYEAFQLTFAASHLICAVCCVSDKKSHQIVLFTISTSLSFFSDRTAHFWIRKFSNKRNNCVICDDNSMKCQLKCKCCEYVGRVYWTDFSEQVVFSNALLCSVRKLVFQRKWSYEQWNKVEISVWMWYGAIRFPFHCIQISSTICDARYCCCCSCRLRCSNFLFFFFKFLLCSLKLGISYRHFNIFSE